MFSSLGGIQRYSRYLLEALFAEPRVAVTEVALKNDLAVAGDFRTPPGTHVGFGGDGGPFRTAAFASTLLWLGLRHRPDVILTSHLNFTPVAHLLKTLTRIPFWAVAHGFEAWDIERPSIRRALRACDRVLAVSSYTRSVLIDKHGLDPARVHLMPNTFDAEAFQPAPKSRALLERYGIAPDAKVILTVARVSERERYKGHDQIIRALPEILQAVPKAHYLIVGRGNDEPRIREMIAQRGLEASFTLADAVPDEELCAHYNLGDVFAMPSKREGFGIVFLEALACGKPVIAGNQDGSVDPLLGGELGVLVDPENGAEIRDAIISVLERKHPLAILYDGPALRQRVITAFGLPRFRATLSRHFTEFFPSENGGPA